jgi:hypothetical protein
VAYQRALNEKVAQLLVPPETHPGEHPESHHQRRAHEKEMKQYMTTLDTMSAHHCHNAFFDVKFGHNPFGITLTTPSDMIHFISGVENTVCIKTMCCTIFLRDQSINLFCRQINYCNLMLLIVA